MPGSVITFYSYKGGVGRSFALANIAVILAQWGSRVLVVDWDIEAPGLNHYFAPFVKEMRAGVLDFLQDVAKDEQRPLAHYTTKVEITGQNGLELMPAAAGGGTDYAGLVQGLDWDELYCDHALGARLEALRAAWIEEFDLVLVDSRTGVTDFSGLTTAQLPDVLAFMFTANGQSLSGCTDIARRAMEARRKIPVDRPALLPLPIPARFEQREEYDRARLWRERFVTELKPFFEVWAPSSVDPLKLIDLLTIPYVPRWTFGEELASLVEPASNSGTRTPGQAASYACETLAALLACGFAKVDLLASSRDEYVHAARALVQSRRAKVEGTSKVFISYSKSDSDTKTIAHSIAHALKKVAGERRKVFFDAEETTVGEDSSNRLRLEIEEADAYIVLIDHSFNKSSFQYEETERLLRQSLRSEQHKAIIPVVVKGGEEAFSRSRLADYQAVFLDQDLGVEEQLTPVMARLSRTSLATSLASSTVTMLRGAKG
jgi:TIR domain/AAA domain